MARGTVVPPDGRLRPRGHRTRYRYGTGPYRNTFPAVTLIFSVGFASLTVSRGHRVMGLDACVPP
jgi:hypothetical protein